MIRGIRLPTGQPASLDRLLAEFPVPLARQMFAPWDDPAGGRWWMRGNERPTLHRADGDGWLALDDFHDWLDPEGDRRLTTTIRDSVREAAERLAVDIMLGDREVPRRPATLLDLMMYPLRDDQGRLWHLLPNPYHWLLCCDDYSIAWSAPAGRSQLDILRVLPAEIRPEGLGKACHVTRTIKDSF